jgi:hypothetical protein
MLARFESLLKTGFFISSLVPFWKALICGYSGALGQIYEGRTGT